MFQILEIGRWIGHATRRSMRILLLPVVAGSLGASFAPETAPSPHVPAVGECQLRVLTPQVLELTLISTQAATDPAPEWWNFVASDTLHLPAAHAFVVRADGRPVPVLAVGFKRRPVYAPLRQRDLRIGNWLYLKLAAPVTADERITVSTRDGPLWPGAGDVSAVVHPFGWSPAIHVNQTGYLPDMPKLAMVGSFLGSLGEMDLPAGQRFQVISADDRRVLYEGALRLRPDQGFEIRPTPYQKVWEADFSAVTNSGRYRLFVAGLGCSSEFHIHPGVAACWARAAALGLYHQRCGTALSLPFTRFVHDACHVRPAEVPTPRFTQVQRFLAGMTADALKNPRHQAPAMTNVSASLYPFVNRGPVDVSGGHHDAGDYSKYTINSAAMIHFLVFAVDVFPGVAVLDNLGIPESQDGWSDLLQEAKWEADFLVKLQDDDGGFYFLVYPRNRKYEDNVPPDKGDPQVVYPKNTSATAAAVAALAQTGSSPTFRRQFPEAAARYTAAALKGWAFLERALESHGRDGAYQKLTHYGNAFIHDDELAWAAAELFLATGDANFEATLKSHFIPSDRATRHWTWWRLFEGYGCAIRSYAFGARSGRISADRLDRAYLSQCEMELKTWANELRRFSEQCAYGTTFPEANKRFLNAGWYFPSSRAFDLAVAWQLDPSGPWASALLSDVNFELGNNPVNVSFVTGLGQRPVREVVSQFALNSWRKLPPSGLLVGSLQSGFPYLDRYGKALGALTFPPDGARTNAYPLYDRWGETFNVTTEAVIVDQARSLATTAFLLARTPCKEQPWRAATGQIAVFPRVLSRGTEVRLKLEAQTVDLGSARVVWEATDMEPFVGQEFRFTPRHAGAYSVEAEALLPDGRRVFAATNVAVNPR